MLVIYQVIWIGCCKPACGAGGSMRAGSIHRRQAGRQTNIAGTEWHSTKYDQVGAEAPEGWSGRPEVARPGRPSPALGAPC